MMKGLAQGPLTQTAVQVTTTAIGQAIPLLYGYDKIGGRSIWYSNFTKGGSGKKGKGGNVYFANIDWLLGFGPMEGVADAWFNGQWQYCYSDMYTVTPGAVTGGQTVSLTIPSSSVANPNSAAVIMVAGVFLGNVPFSASYNDFVYSGYFNAFSQSGNGIIPLNNSAFPAPNTKNYNTSLGPYASYNTSYGSKSVSVTFPQPLGAGFTINVLYYFAPHNDKAIPLSAASLMFWETQLGTGDSGQPITYPEFSGTGGASVPLGSSAIIPQIQWHTKGLFGLGYPCDQGAIAGWINNGDQQPIVQMWSSGDCNPADIIVDLITSGNDVARFGSSAVWNHGAGFNNNVLDGTGGTDNLLQYSRYGGIIVDEGSGFGLNKLRNFCHAYSIYLSGSIVDQTSLAQVLTDLSEMTTCAPVWDGASLDFIPYCEVSQFGNGVSYIPPTAVGPLFTLTRSNFLTERKTKSKGSTSKPPVVHSGGVPSDNWNSLVINFKDRTGQTNNNAVIVSDAYDISRQGPQNQGQKSYPWIQIPSVATSIGWAILRRNVNVLRDGTYKFDLPACWSVVFTPMDLVQLNEPSLGPNLIPVRITRIEEQEDFSISIEAERYIYGACVPSTPQASVTSVSSGSTGGGGTGSTSTGSVNTPIIFEAIPGIAGHPQLWFCVSGPPPVTGAVVSVTITNGGSGYTGVPSVSITGGGGSGATAVANVNFTTGQVTSVTMITSGSGYGVGVSVGFSGGGGTGAAATPVTGNASSSYSGAVVMISTDGGTTYNPINGNNSDSTIIGEQTMGAVFSSNFPSHTDPDSVDTLNVDLTESAGTLSTFTTAQRDAFINSLCYLAGGGTVAGANGITLTIPYELISYATPTLTSPSKYAINGATTSIRRGVYGTPIATHNIGSAFSFLVDGEVFKWDLPNSLVGVTLFFKFLSVSNNGTSIQPLPSATAYSFTPTGEVGWGQTNYSITPNPAVYQGQSGGWPGVDANSTTWTNTAFVYVPPTTATFTSGRTLFYNARDAGFNVFTVSGGGETAWVTVFDPTQTGETVGNSSLTMFCDISSTPPARWNTPGYIRIGTITSKALGSGGGSGGGGGTGGTTGPYLIPFFQGDATAAGPPASSQVLLTHKIATQFGGTPINNVTLPLGLSGSVGGCKVNPTSAATITIKQNGSSIGTINISTGGVMTFTFTSAITLNPGDILDFVNQNPADTTLAGVFWTISGSRS